MNYRAIGFGEADLEIERELADVSGGDQLVPSGPPEAQAVYVCGECFEIVDPCVLNWENQEVHVCDRCADKYFTRKP